MIAEFFNAALTGFSSLVFLYPLDYMRTRLATDVGGTHREFEGLSDLCRKTLHGGGKGVWSFYHGMSPALAGPLLYRSTYLAIYDYARALMPTNSIVGRFVFVQGITVALSFLTYPLDTLTHRMQMDSAKMPHERLYKNLLHCFHRIKYEEGVLALWRGSAITWLSVAGGAGLVIIDEIRRRLREDDD